jgi:methylaspartate mutase epsilon subunit
VVRQQKIDFALEEVLAEERIAEMEVRALLDRIFELGDGDVAVGLIKAFDAGYMDSPFSSNIHVRGRAMGVRDLRGACRYLDFGLLPLPQEAKEYHRSKIEERERAQGKKLDYHMVVQEFWSLSKGRLIEE